MDSNCVLLHVAPNGVARLTFNRAELHNAIDEAVISQFKARLAEVASDPRVRVLIVAGNGKSFCAGADLNWMKRTADYDEERNYRDALEFTELLEALDTLPKPAIARVHGPAYGGGVGIVCACDIALGTPQALFMFSEVKLGLVPAMISPYAVAAIGALLATVLTGPTAGAAEPNLLANPGFESGLDDWTCSGGSGTAASGTVHSGTGALEAPPAGQDNARCSQVVAVRPGAEYTW